MIPHAFVSFSSVLDGSELGAGFTDGIDGMSFTFASFLCFFDVFMYLCVNMDAMEQFWM